MLAMVGHNSGKRTRCIFRAHGERSYTKLCNGFLQDRRLSYETRGLIGHLLSLPDDWEVTVQSIIASGPAGRDKVYRMLKEAEDFGYIKPEQGRKTAGKFDRQLYLVTDNPTSLIERAALEIAKIEMGIDPLTDFPEPASFGVEIEPLTENTEAAEVAEINGFQPLTDLPLTAQPFTGEPLTENTDTYKRNIEDNKTPIAPLAEKAPKRRRGPVPDEYPHDFEEFWKVYPRREGKGNALVAWQRLTLAQKRKAYLALKSQMRDLLAKLNDQRGNYCPHPATWINQGRFDDDPATRGSPPAKGDRLLDGSDMPLTKPRPADEA